MMTITKSPEADSKSSKTPPTVEQLTTSTESHINDVKLGLEFISKELIKRGLKHDNTKLSMMDEFHAALNSGHIKDTEWYHKHITEERHHLKSNVPEDVNLIDVIEHLVDCTMAGLTRSGQIYDTDISPEVLQLAAQNTVELLKKNIIIVDPDKDILDEEV